MKKVIIELFNNTTFLTVLSGVIVFVLSEFVMEYVINPKRKFKELKERIAYILAMYCCYYTNPYRFDKKIHVRDISEYTEASKEVRKIGAELSGYIGNIPVIRWHKRKQLLEVRDCLIGLSNSFYLYSGEGLDTINNSKQLEKRIKDILKIKDRKKS